MSENHYEWFLADRFGKIYNFDKNKIILGRKDCDIQLKSNSVDYKHCILAINEKDKSLKIKDLETANGTFINEKQIKPNNFKSLNVGDKIRLAYDQITFTVQRKIDVIATSSPSRGTDLPGLVTDPERFMPPVVCELTDSTIELSSSFTLNHISSEEKVNENSSNVHPMKSEIEFCQVAVSEKLSNSHFTSVKSQNNFQHKEQSSIIMPVSYGPSRAAESFTINFTNDDLHDNDSSSVSHTKFVPLKFRSSFEGRDKIPRTKVQTSNSFNKPDTSIPKSKVENKNNLPKPTKTGSFSKTKLHSKTDEAPIIKSKSINTKKIPEKNMKPKPDSNSRVHVKQLKAMSDNREKRSVTDTKEKKSFNESHDKKSLKPSTNSSKIITPTVCKRNSKSYLFEKMWMGNECTIDFIDFDERNQDPIKPVLNNGMMPIVNLNNNHIILPIIDDFVGTTQNNVDIIDTASEAGTYVIETETKEKSIDTEGTLERDDNSSISSIHFNAEELESKSSTKWLSEFPTDDSVMDMDGKCKRNPTTKFNGCSMPHIPTNMSMESERAKCYKVDEVIGRRIIVINRTQKKTRDSHESGIFHSSLLHKQMEEFSFKHYKKISLDDENPKLNTNCVVNDMRSRNARVPSYNVEDPNNNVNSEDMKNWYLNESDSNKTTGNSAKTDFQSNQQQSTISPYGMGNQSLLAAEDVYVSDISTNSTVPTNSYTRMSSLPQKSKDMDLFSPINFRSTQPNVNYHPRPTCSVASLDTALLLQDTEALLNDMEKRVYSRREIKTTEEFSRIQPFSTSFPQSEKIPYVDDGEEREEDTSLFNYSADNEEAVRLATMKQQTPLLNNSEPVNSEDKSLSYTVRSPITTGIIRRNNSCKVGLSESQATQPNIVGRKLNNTIRNQRSCSLIEERKLNHNNNNIDSFTDYRNKPKLSLFAMNSGTFVNRRGSGSGYSSALNSPITKFEPISAFNSSFSNQKSKDTIPYLSNILSVHRQKFNRYEYGQHSLKYNSNSTTMLYNKYNNISPPWNGDEPNSHNLTYSNYDADYYSYNTMPDSIEASMLFLKHEPNIIENMQQHHLNINSNVDPDFQRREDNVEFSQPGNISGRSSAFSPVNSLHQSNESVNNFQITGKSRSSVGLNEQKLYNYDFLLVSSIHLYSARLCRYSEEIVHRLRREDPEYKPTSPIDSNLEQSDTFGQLKSANRELQETLNNMRSLEKQLQKIEKAVFPPEKSGRNSTLGSCTEDSYLNQLERINKELEDFVPIDDEKVSLNKNTSSAKTSARQKYSYLTSNDSKSNCPITISKSMDKKSKTRTDSKHDDSKSTYSTSEICSSTKSKYSSLSKRFQNRKD